MGIDGFDSEAAHVFLLDIKKKHPYELVVLVWDNAPGHRVKKRREIPGLIVRNLPPYSPQLNPTERFFEEVRRATANTIFKTIEDQERVIERRVLELSDSPSRMRKLLCYDWIWKQAIGVS
jgi:transposase